MRLGPVRLGAHFMGSHPGLRDEQTNTICDFWLYYIPVV